MVNLTFTLCQESVWRGHIGGLVAGVMLAYVFSSKREAHFMNRTYQPSAVLSYLLFLLYLGKILDLFYKKVRTKVLASNCFWIVEQDLVVEGSTTLISSAFTALTNCAEVGTTTELTSPPLSFFPKNVAQSY